MDINEIQWIGLRLGPFDIVLLCFVCVAFAFVQRKERGLARLAALVPPVG